MSPGPLTTTDDRIIIAENAEIDRLRVELQTCRNTAKINLKVAQDRAALNKELLAALQSAALQLETGVQAAQVAQQIRAAIRKAKGG